MRTTRVIAWFPENVNRQHDWTVHKNSRKDVMAAQKTAMTFVKNTELESADSENCCKGNRNFEFVDCWLAFGESLDLWPGARFSKVPTTFRARKASRKTTTCLFCKAGLFICCKGSKNENNCKVSCLETPSFWRYKENCVTRNTPETFRDFRETGPWLRRLR